MTGRELVAACLRKIGAVAPGESIDADEASDGLAEINRMLSSWSNDGLVIYADTAETALTLTPGDATYTLGASGNITTRPQAIEKALIREGTIDHPVDLISLSEFTAIVNKSTQSPYPTKLYDDGGYPQRTITLYPVPSAANQLLLYTKRALTSIASLSTDIAFPPGYEDALVYNGALRLAPEYGKPVDSMILKIAQDSLEGIKRVNHRPVYLTSDPAVLGLKPFDINSGSTS